MKASEIAMDRRHRHILNYNISKYDQTVSEGRKKYINFHQARDFASSVKTDALEHLAEYLETLQQKLESRGTRVFRAADSHEALDIIRKILVDNRSALTVKSKSMVTEEIGFNEFAQQNKVKVFETDLGEFIVQTAGEKPYHILTPAMHKSKEDVADLFNREFHLPKNSQPFEIAAFVRKHLRKIFTESDLGVTGANFLVADIGGIGLTENEGNGCMTVSFPRMHLVIAGIERMIPSVKQLPFFLQWLAVHGTGQNISAYNSLVLGPRSSEEIDGPEKMVVILLDNRRSRLLEDKELQPALKCIRCGSCLNACPIYTNIGGYTYAATYTGPIGSVITPVMNGFRDYGHLSFACTLCGRCSEVCPVKIPLHELMFINRRRKVENYPDSFLWNQSMHLYAYIFEKRRRVEWIKGNLRNSWMRFMPEPLGKYKKTAEFASASFSKQWNSQKT